MEGLPGGCIEIIWVIQPLLFGFWYTCKYTYPCVLSSEVQHRCEHTHRVAHNAPDLHAGFYTNSFLNTHILLHTHVLCCIILNVYIPIPSSAHTSMHMQPYLYGNINISLLSLNVTLIATSPCGGLNTQSSSLAHTSSPTFGSNPAPVLGSPLLTH